MFTYIEVGLGCAMAGFVFGYLFCFRNPPQSLKDKAAKEAQDLLNKVTGK